jgi:CDP-diacylglycerol---glycerol-3-phosphate 3-phosphatidyltransferase
MANLKRSWAVWAGVCTLGLAGAAAGLFLLTGPQLTLRWLAPASGVFIYQLIYLYRHLDENRNKDSGKFYTRLGLANWLTVGRGALLAFVAGFLFIPRPSGWLGWVPALIYLAAVLIDYVDGYAARRSGMTSQLGSRLDMHIDVHGYLIGGFLLAQWGQVPFWYLVVPLARPLYVLGEWVLKRQARSLRPLYPNQFRRALSGAQMGFTAVLLFPVFTPPGTTIAATIYMLPFLTTFLLDWLWVSGALPETFLQPSEWRFRLTKGLQNWLPLLLRAVLVILLIARLLQPGLPGIYTGLIYIMHGLAVIAVLTGSLGRVVAVGVMLLSGLYLQINTGDLLSWGLLLTSLSLFFSGTGRFSLWKPEDWLIYHIAGEKSKN